MAAHFVRWGTVFVLLALGGCAIPVAAPPPPAAPALVATRDLTAGEKATLAALFGAGLKDPESARFEWAKMPVATDGEVFYCAIVNAKNGFGGYVGAEPFFGRVRLERGKINAAELIGLGGGSYTEFVLNQCRANGVDPFQRSL